MIRRDEGGAFPFRLHPFIKWPVAMLLLAVLIAPGALLLHEWMHCLYPWWHVVEPCQITIQHPARWTLDSWMAHATPHTPGDHWLIWPATIAIAAGTWIMWADTVGD